MSNTVQVVGNQQVVIQETAAQVIEVISPAQPAVVEVSTAGPQGLDGVGLPTGGDPGNVLLKGSYTNYDAEWSAVVDGGTFN